MSKELRIVIKRDNSKQEFDYNKIETAVAKAFNSTGFAFGQTDKKKFKEYIIANMDNIEGDIPIETIQDYVEHFLMQNFPAVAKPFILYREKHKKLREYTDRKKQFIKRFIESDNTANATIDDNSNVSSHNIAVLNSEIHKEENREINIRLWEDKLKELYPDFDHKKLLSDLNTICYGHDMSSQVGMPYTYSSKEVVEVMYGDSHWLCPFDLLYDLINIDEQCVDQDNKVWIKTPRSLFVKDFHNKWTKVTKVTKKKRHRNLVRVKTAFGEDVVVTDNHPMIVDINNVDNTIEAKDSLGYKQYKAESEIEFLGKTSIDLASILPTFITIQDNYIIYNGNPMKRLVSLSKEFGYVVGFFVGDGRYNNTSKSLDFMQKDKSVLQTINSILFNTFGITGKIHVSDDKYTLSVANRYIYELFRGYFKIQDKAQNKTLPINILDFTEDFAEGILAGLIDSDGSIKRNECSISIRLSSRACILQATALFRYFNYSVGNSIQSLPFSNNTSYKTNYTIWGINATYRNSSRKIEMSSKVKNNLVLSKEAAFKYSKVGTSSITKVQQIEGQSSFLTQNEYIYDITTETHTFACNNLVVHNCVAITMYPFLLNGLKDLGGLSAAPKNIDSFCGLFVNLVFAIASQYKGACATPSVLLSMDWFLRKEWGNNYHIKKDTVISGEACVRKQTIHKQIHQYFQQICYSLMQPAGSRGNQSVFWNLSIFDKPFYDTMYGDFYFPDGSKPNWESFNWLQKDFLHWLNQERLKCILTFPVVSVCLLYKNHEFLDKELADYAAEEYAEGNSFFTFISDSAESLSSCCRLSSKLAKPQFNFTNGQLSEMTGSKNVITLNISRIIQDCDREFNIKNQNGWKENVSVIKDYLVNILDRIYKYQTAYNECLKDLYKAGLLSVYNAGFIDLKKQYLTIGINGLNQAAEYLGMKCDKNIDYEKFCNLIFSTIKEQNTMHKTKELMFNTEFTPCESAAIKLYNRDKKDGYWVPDDTNLYASYIFKPNDKDISILDKIYLHGRNFCGDNLDGGSAAHLGLDTHLSKEQYNKILKYAAEVGCKYFTFNVPNSECQDCGYITKVPIKECPKCHSHKIDYYDRVIG